MPQDDLGATLDELQSLVAGVGVGDATLPKPCVAGSNPAGAPGQSHKGLDLPICGAARGARLELWVTRAKADARILIIHKIAQ
jgi:hypothetical protein